ncbi:MAG TPA: PEGA domain-containing protein [Polyangiaceae bacterium]|jgi:hypothetical protein
MRARSLVAALAIAAGSLGAPPPPALAAPPGPAAPSPADLAAAKKLFETGLKLYSEGSYREALASFKRANDIAPRASLQRNIAQCHRDLKDFASAYDAYQTLLARYGATMSAGDKRAIQRAIEELGMLTGTVRVTVAEPGAAVTLDGNDAGTTPLGGPLRVNLGPHAVAVTKAGFETLQKEVKLGGGDEATVDGPMQPEVTTGHLVVSAPPDAKVNVVVDGTDMGPAPWEGDVKPGVHVVEGRGADKLSQPKQVDVARRDRVELVLEVVAPTGKVQIDTHTADAVIAIDARPVGKGVWEGELPAGQHEVTIEAPGFRTYKRAFLVHAGEAFVEDARLESESGEAQRYEGIYSGLGFFGYVSPSGATNDIAQACPTTPCSTSSPLGAGLLVRVGYSFGWIAVEGVALGEYDYATANLTYSGLLAPTDPHAGPARTEDYTFHRFGGGGAIGGRVATKHPHIRLTAGAFGGVVERGNIYKRTASPTGSGQGDEYTSDTISYTAPLLMFDAGVLVGWQNGPKFHVGGLFMLEFVGDPVVAPSPTQRTLTVAGVTSNLGTPPLGLASGTQFFLGPVIGFDFGL